MRNWTSLRAVVFGLTMLESLLGPLPLLAADGPPALERFLLKASSATVSDLLVTQEIVLTDPGGSGQKALGEQRLYLKPPVRRRIEITVEGERIVRLVNGSRLVIQRGGKSYEASSAERLRDSRDLTLPFQRSARELLAQWQSYGVRTDLVREAEYAGRRVTVFGASRDDSSAPTVWLDPDLGVVRLIVREETPVGPKRVELSFSDFRPLIGEMSYPYRQETLLEGKPFITTTVKSIRMNSGLADDLFDPDRLLRESR